MEAEESPGAPVAARVADLADPGIPGMMRTPLWWPNNGAPPDSSPLDTPVSQDQGPDDDPAIELPPAPTEFAWSFDDVDEVRTRSSVGRGLAWIAVAAVCVAAVVATAVFAGGDDNKQSSTALPPPATAPPPAPPGPVEAYVPRNLALGGFDGRVQVTWQPPERADQVAGFMVVAQSRQGVVLEHRLAPAGDTSAVFTTPPMTRDACVVVATLVRGASGVSPVRAEPVCL